MASGIIYIYEREIDKLANEENIPKNEKVTDFMRFCFFE